MALSVDTPIPTPTGWTSVNDLQAHHIVFDELGYPCRIKSISEPYKSPVYRMGIGWDKKNTSHAGKTETSFLVTGDHQFYNFTFRRFEDMVMISDRGPTSILVHNKLPTMPDNWTTWSYSDLPRESRKGRKAQPKAQVQSTKEIAETMTFVRRKAQKPLLNHKIPITFPLQTNTMDYMIDPWIMGVMVNYYRDGELTLTRSTYPFYQEKFSYRGLHINYPEDGTKKAPISHLKFELPQYDKYLKSIGFTPGQIPERYLRGSVEQRMDLLSGIMDQHSDRFRMRTGQCDLWYRTHDPIQRDRMLELVRSLGYPAFTHTENLNCHLVRWHPMELPFTMPKLRFRYNFMLNSRLSNIRKLVWTVTECYEDGEATVRDIEVDSPYGLITVSKAFLPVRGMTNG